MKTPIQELTAVLVDNKYNLIKVLGILGESKKCIMQNTNMNAHCEYTLSQIDKAKEILDMLIKQPRPLRNLNEIEVIDHEEIKPNEKTH